MPGKRGRPRKRSYIGSNSRNDKHKGSTTKFKPSVDPENEQHGYSILKADTVHVTFCFICNQKYETTAASSEKYESSRTNVLAFCQTFKLHEECEKEMLTLAGFADPFCLHCCDKIFTLKSIAIQLKQLLSTLQELNSELGDLMVSSFPGSAHIGGTYYIKEKLVQDVVATGIRGNGTHDVAKDEKLEIELVNDLLHLAPELEETVTSLEASSETGIDDIVIDAGDQQSDGNDDDYFPPIVPTRNSGNRKSLQSTGLKSSAKRAKTTWSSKHEIITADPSGQCHLCPNKFTTQFALTRHLKRIHSGITYSCRYCYKTFQDTSNRKKHEFAVHIARSRGRNFTCDQCGNSYYSVETLRDHIRRKHEGKIKKSHIRNPTPCQYCGKILSCQNTYGRHIRLAHKPPPENRKTHICPTCGRPFFVLQSMNRHQLSHLSLEEQALREGKTYFYKCNICPVEGQIGFKTRVAMIDHFKMEHPTESARQALKTFPSKPRPRSTPYKFPCEECPQRPLFKTEDDLQAHILAGHKEKKRIKVPANCDICGKPCPDAYDAKQHQATHNPKCYFCSHCAERALHKGDMRAHYEEYHPGVSPPPESLKIFMVGEKSFFCSDCPDHPGFTRKKRLNDHIRNGHVVKKKGRKSNAEKGRPRRTRVQRPLVKVRPLKHIIVKKYLPSSDSSRSESEDESDMTETEELSIGRVWNTPTPTQRTNRSTSWKVSHVKHEQQEVSESKVPLQRLDLGPFLKIVKVSVVQQNLCL